MFIKFKKNINIFILSITISIINLKANAHAIESDSTNINTSNEKIYIGSYSLHKSKKFHLFSNETNLAQVTGFAGKYIFNLPGTIIWSTATIPFYTFGGKFDIPRIIGSSYELSDYTYGYFGYILLGAPFDLIEKLFWVMLCRLYNSAFGGEG